MGESKTSSVKSEVVRYWSPENENLIIGGGSAICFKEHRIFVKTPSVIKRLESSPVYGKLFFKVHDKPSTGDDRVRMMRFLNRLLESDPSDQVKAERGVMSVLALFDEDELQEIGISRSLVDKERLILASLDRKTVEGV